MTTTESLESAYGRTALVHDWLTGMRGGENVLAEIGSLFPTSPIYTLLHIEGSVDGAIASHPIRTSYLQRVPGIARHYRKYLPLFPAAIEDFNLEGFDLIVSSSHCVAKGVIPHPGSFHVCYCHSPMRYAWDQEHAYFPGRRGLKARVRGALLSRLRRWDVAASSRVDLFLANSSFVATRIRRYYRREAEVLHPPVDVEFFTPGDGTDGESHDYCLMVAALAPYKKIDLAIEACRRLGLGLHVVGYGPERGRLRKLAGPDVHFHERIEAEPLRQLYRGARCLLQPGVEDFGISSVEALACGCPVVASGRGGIRDIAEDGVHGVLFDVDGAEGDPAAALTEAIDKSARIRFNSLNLRERAEDFSGSRFRKRFQEILATHRLAEGSDT